MDSLFEAQGSSLESEYVRSTYDAIAGDFSSTRYKKWPKVDAFLQSLSPGSLLLDVGCGNGKYLDNSQTFNIGCDLSLNLLKICKTKGLEVVLCDMTRLPFRRAMFDSVICVAALHHLATAKRRQRCLADMVELMDPMRSKCLIQVWSFEQQRDKDNPYLSNRKGVTAEAGAAKVVIDNQIELPIHKNRTPFVEQDVLVPFHIRSVAETAKSCRTEHDEQATSGQKLRYYHVFREGELEEMFQRIPPIIIAQSYYDKGNWCIVAGKGDAVTESSVVGPQP